MVLLVEYCFHALGAVSGTAFCRMMFNVSASSAANITM